MQNRFVEMQNNANVESLSSFCLRKLARANQGLPLEIPPKLACFPSWFV